MSKHLISDQILNSLANRIATITGTTLPMTPSDMVAALTSQAESIKTATISKYSILSNQTQISFSVKGLKNLDQIQALFVNRKVNNPDIYQEIVIQASFIKDSSVSQLSEDANQSNALSLISSQDFIAINNGTITLTALNAASWNRTISETIDDETKYTYAYEIVIFYS